MTRVLLAALVVAIGAQPQPDKQLVATIAGPDLRGGIVSEVTWDGGVVVIQGVFAKPGGELDAHYFVIPADRVALEKRAEQSAGSLKYWNSKSNRVSPTGLGRITSSSDTKLPQYGIGSLERRMSDSVDMGGTQTRSVLRLGALTIHERNGPEPYDGEVWSWSPPEINRIAYVDGHGDLWIADADGRNARRLLRGEFTLPAWSDDGTAIAVAERKDGGRSWEISVVHVPVSLRGGR